MGIDVVDKWLNGELVTVEVDQERPNGTLLDRGVMRMSELLRYQLLAAYITVGRALKELQMNSPLRRRGVPIYQLAFGPSQLQFMCQCIDATRDVEGRIAEIGCNDGRTTTYLCMYLFDTGNEKRYVALDTFTGFAPEDVEFERRHRGKRLSFEYLFRQNKKKWFDFTMQVNNICRVESIQADVNEYELTTLGPLSFVLLDVDLYRPMRKALPELYRALTPGGIMIADDCNPNNRWWDGAYYAYLEFMEGIGQPPEIVHGKLGVIRKPRVSSP
jgi:O-methyltransferase